MLLPKTILDALSFFKLATCPEDIFGDDVKSAFRELAMLVHEDRAAQKEKVIAHEAFLLLSKWHDLAEEKIKQGNYGDKKPAIIAKISTKTNEYNLFKLIAEQDIANYYLGRDKDDKVILVKICNSPADNDLMKNEADILTTLFAKIDPKHTPYFPSLLDSLEIGGSIRQRVNVFTYTEGAVSVEEVIKAHPNGIHSADAAWMWNRCLEALHLFHSNGYVHASVTPESFIIVPETHQGILIDFCYAVKVGAKAKAINSKWESHYPSEIFSKIPLDCSVDLYNASFLLEQLIKKNIHPRVKAIIKSCRLGKAHRPKSAQLIHEDIAKVWLSLHGPKKFREFKMPKGV
jgi:serine/threonine protein kinase